MIGEEHAEAARWLLSNAPGADAVNDPAIAVQAAQVHATLALLDAVKALAPPVVQVKYSDHGSVAPIDVQEANRHRIGCFPPV